MGLKEVSQSFSKVIKTVKAGKEVILTERGNPIAVIKPLDQKKNVEPVLRRLEANGILRRGPKSGNPMPVWRFPVRVKGSPVANKISKERDER